VGGAQVLGPLAPLGGRQLGAELVG